MTGFHYVCILQSEKSADHFYVGLTEELGRGFNAIIRVLCRTRPSFVHEKLSRQLRSGNGNALLSSNAT
jgi:hypothetical protein